MRRHPLVRRLFPPLAWSLLAAAVLWGAPAAAALSAEDIALVSRAEAALNRIRSIESRFVQSSSNGRYAHGMLYVDRPGNLRIDYAPPTPLQVYGDGFWLIYLDFELKQANQVPINSTPAAFLVRDKLSLTGDLTVTGVTHEPQRIWLSIVRSDDHEGGGLRLGLDPATLALREWVISDPQGIDTRVSLIDPAINRPIDKSVFIYSPPDWATGPP